MSCATFNIDKISIYYNILLGGEILGSGPTIKIRNAIRLYRKKYISGEDLDAIVKPMKSHDVVTAFKSTCLNEKDKAVLFKYYMLHLLGEREVAEAVLKFSLESILLEEETIDFMKREVKKSQHYKDILIKDLGITTID